MGDGSGGGHGSFTWLGHAAVEVVSASGTRILFDPWLGNPRSPRAVESVDACDVLLVTHGHGDHVGDALQIAKRTHPVWPAIHEISLWLGDELAEGDAEVIGMNKGGTVQARDVRVTMVGADHSGGDWSDANSMPRYLGEPAGFVVELADGYRLYHAGDTAAFGDMALIRELFKPDVAFLPIGGHFTMDPRGAALAAKMLGVPAVVPIHYGTFPILAGTPDELRQELEARGAGNVSVLSPEPGEETPLP
jgi:L-ascorbate metabolism protein UlaG (beta-lactamase superfamily)